MISIDLFTAFAIVLAAPGASVVTAAPSAEPQDAFAAAVTSCAESGWRLADVEVDETDSTITARLTYTRNAAATTLSLRYDSSSGTFLSFDERRAKRPPRDRIYRFESELAAAMENGAPTGIEFGCADC